MKEDLDQEDNLRIINHASRVQTTLAEFRKAAILRHIARIEHFIRECFSQLIHKKNFVTSLQIEPETFFVTLRDQSHRVITQERLSAGERQLLAVATLWDLARASGRPLPTIIDTPLGRLDTRHRNNLVTRYFPHASHQVILLSTDEEIVGPYLDRIKPKVGRAYELVFDQNEHSTPVKPGYFAMGPEHVC